MKTIAFILTFLVLSLGHREAVAELVSHHMRSLEGDWIWDESMGHLFDLGEDWYYSPEKGYVWRDDFIGWGWAYLAETDKWVYIENVNIYDFDQKEWKLFTSPIKYWMGYSSFTETQLIDGVEVALSVFLWRDFMPILIVPGSNYSDRANDLMGVIHLSVASDEDPVLNLKLNRIWLYQKTEREIYQTSLTSRETTYPPEGRTYLAEASFWGGPQWPTTKIYHLLDQNGVLMLETDSKTTVSVVVEAYREYDLEQVEFFYFRKDLVKIVRTN